ARWRLVPFLIAALAVAQGVFAFPLRYSTYTEGQTTIAAGADGAIVSVTQVRLPPFSSPGIRVMRLAPGTQSVVWSTTLPWAVSANSVAVAADGSIWITGATSGTTGIPFINPLPGAATAENGAFIAHLSADGSTVL